MSASRNKWCVFAVVQLGILLCALNATVIFLALPTIAADLHLGLDSAQWIGVSYLVTCGATLSLAGKLADLMGRKPAYLLGFVIFTIASLAAGFASNLGWLVTARAATAVGTAFLLSSSNVITVAIFPKEQHGMALGIGATVYSVGFGLGLSLGALILHLASWRWIFIINLPVGIAGVVLGMLFFDPEHIGKARPRKLPLDFRGAVFLSSSIAALLLGLQSVSRQQHQLSLLQFAISLAAGFLFVKTERAAPDPIIPLALFKVREISIGSITRIIMRMAGSGASFTMPFYLQRNLGLTPGQTGLVMLAFVGAFAFGGPFSGYAANRWGVRPVLITGLCMLALGTALHLLLPNGASSPAAALMLNVICGQALMGLGAALFGAPNTNAAMRSVPPNQQGVASGILWTTSFVGQAFGTAMAAILLNQAATVLNGPIHNQRAVFATLTLLLFVAICLSAKWGPTLQPQPKPAPAA
jgi:EmrB/QacA subfamily drug resistance transporter